MSLSMFGYVCVVFSVAVGLARAMWIQKRYPEERDRVLFVNCIGIFTFYGLGLILFVHIRHIFYALYDSHAASGNLSRVFDWDFQFALALISTGIVIQVFALHAPKSLFSRMVVPAIINLAVWAFVYPLVGLGVINLVWMILLTAVQSALVVVVRVFDQLTGLLADIERHSDTHPKKLEFLVEIRNEANGLLKMGFTGFLALGASVGVSMSILFGAGEEAWNLVTNQINAARLVAGFSLITFGLGVWLAKPYMECTEAIRGLYLTAGPDDNSTPEDGE